MFLFYHTNQKSDNTSHYKGILFEELLKEFLTERGYDVNFYRIKKNSLEYDIEGKDRTTQSEIIGEAKALSIPISAEIFTSFLGKLMIVRLEKEKICGLFLSISRFTAEAHENYLKAKEKYRIVAITGKELYLDIKEEFCLIPSVSLINKLKHQKYIVLNEYILASDIGKYFVLICSSPNSVVPSYFLILDQDGNEISDDNFILCLKKNIKELSQLTYIKIKEQNKLQIDRTISKGILVGNSWIDFRLPAAPQYFIGRKKICEEIFDHIENNFQENIIQIKSRAGVGKSSLLSFLDQNLSKKNIHTELHDARNIKSILDIFVIVQRFTKSSHLPNDFEDVEKQIEKLYIQDNTLKAVIMVDQFESTFNNPDVYNAYESLINIIFNYRDKIFVILARKSDQLTTYDDSKISLDKINSLSHSFELIDFIKDEAKDLIEKIDEESTKTINSEIKSYVLGFAMGFPYLLKKTMAHIIKMTNLGFTQKELADRSFNLEDLFKEELRELDEIERDYLKRIAHYLPADTNELQHQFKEDTFLLKTLNKLTSVKLLRLTGVTYDTYSDVFKEYLKTEKIPEYHPATIYRLFPNSVLAVFHDLIKNRKTIFPIEDIQDLSKVTKGHAFNLIKELRNLDLVRAVGEYWEIPKPVLDLYSEESFGEYIRNQIIGNELVIKLINFLAEEKTLTLQTLPCFLSEQFPFIEANDKTWTTYSNILISWLELTQIIVIGSDDNLSIISKESEKINIELGNLTDISLTGRRYKTEYFLPSTSFKNVEECFRVICNDISQIKNANPKAISDLRNGGWLSNNILNIDNLSEFKKQAIERIETESHDIIWQAAKRGEFLFKIFKETFGEYYSDETNRWRLIKLINWGRSLEIIPHKRYKYTERLRKPENLVIKRPRKAKNLSPRKPKVKKSILSQIVWDNHYKELEAFINKNKHSCVPRNGITKTLGYWVTSLRTKRKRKLLSEEKIDLLNQINFDWDPIKNVWDKRYRDLLKFKEEYGHAYVPRDYDKKLYFWTKNQRMSISRGSITPERKELLLKIGILEKYSPSQTALIPIDTFNLLKEYHSKYGHINVPQKDEVYKSLGRWINDQRVNKMRGKINEERKKILEEMGIVWNIKENNWDKKFKELQRFYNKYGHFNATRKNLDFPGLGKWIYDLKRKENLSDERIRQLSAIGFDWEKEKSK